MIQTRRTESDSFRYAACLLIALSSLTTYAQDTGIVYSKKGKAINGYDPVAYFTDGAPSKGIDAYAFKWNGATWLFKNDANLKLFQSDPQKYSPQFGGWCAFGVSENHKSPTDPNAWTIIDHKLYLNYNMKVKELWSKDTDENIRKGLANWQNLKAQ